MHTSDKTLLNRLGFQDPDKRSPLHDLICQYISEPEVTNRLLGLAGVTPERRLNGTLDTKAAQEFVLSKGDGPYKQHIGFIDVAVGACYEFALSRTRYNARDSVCVGYLFVEVKVELPPIGDLVRQIKLYQSYIADGAWAVVTPAAMSQGYRDALLAEGITPVTIGADFETWRTNQAALPAASLASL